MLKNLEKLKSTCREATLTPLLLVNLIQFKKLQFFGVIN